MHKHESTLDIPEEGPRGAPQGGEYDSTIPRIGLRNLLPSISVFLVLPLCSAVMIVVGHSPDPFFELVHTGTIGGLVALGICAVVAKYQRPPRRFQRSDAIRAACWTTIGYALGTMCANYYGPHFAVCAPLRSRIVVSAIAVSVGAIVVSSIFWPMATPEVEGCCSKCGYSLRGLRESRCPECGAEFRGVRLDAPQSQCGEEEREK